MNPIEIKIQSRCDESKLLSFSPALPVPEKADLAQEAGRFLSQLVQPFSRLIGIDFFADPTPASSGVTTSRSSIYFGDVDIYSSSLEYFYVNNNAPCKVDVNMTSPSGFSISPSSATISAGSSESISVTFSPRSAQKYSGYVSGNHGISVYLDGDGKDNSQGY